MRPEVTGIARLPLFPNRHLRVFLRNVVSGVEFQGLAGLRLCLAGFPLISAQCTEIDARFGITRIYSERSFVQAYSPASIWFNLVHRL